MKNSHPIIIVGGGLAGLCNAIHLAQSRIEVLLIEKNAYPHHKVCGEYISNEVLPYLDFLGVELNSLKPKSLDRFAFIHQSGHSFNTALPLGGFGLSRFAFDHQLYLRALEAGVTILHDNVENIETKSERDFFVETKNHGTLATNLVISAHGKREKIDGILKRKFFSQKSPWLAVKYHAKADFDENLVALYHFEGGYCGVSKIETNEVNICYLADYKSFKKHKNIAAYQQNVLYKNKELKKVMENSLSTFENPLTISQIYFGKKPLVENHILMCGDAGGLIHPLCGNGMAMAIESASILSPLILRYLNEKRFSREELELTYISRWNEKFSRRMMAGKCLQNLLRPGILSSLALQGLKLFPAALPLIIKQTHGSPKETPIANASKFKK